MSETAGIEAVLDGAKFLKEVVIELLPEVESLAPGLRDHITLELGRITAATECMQAIIREAEADSDEPRDSVPSDVDTVEPRRLVGGPAEEELPAGILDVETGFSTLESPDAENPKESPDIKQWLDKGFAKYERVETGLARPLRQSELRMLDHLKAHPGKVQVAQKLADPLIEPGKVSKNTALSRIETTLNIIGLQPRAELGGVLLWRMAQKSKALEVVYVPFEPTPTEPAAQLLPEMTVTGTFSGAEAAQVQADEPLPPALLEESSSEPEVPVVEQETNATMPASTTVIPEAPSAAPEDSDIELTEPASVEKETISQAPEAEQQLPYKLFDSSQFVLLDNDVTDIMDIPRLPHQHAILLTRRGLTIVAKPNGTWEFNLRGKSIGLDGPEKAVVTVLLQRAMDKKEPISAAQLREEIVPVVGRLASRQFETIAKSVLRKLGDNNAGFTSGVNYEVQGPHRTTYHAKGVIAAIPPRDVLGQFVADAKAKRVS